jgi:hypothetical protein
MAQKLQSPGNEIKRFKSEDKIRTDNLMKTSDGETAYTRSPKCSYAAKGPSAVERVPQCLGYQTPKRLEETSFVIDLEDGFSHKEKKDKKDLSYS